MVQPIVTGIQKHVMSISKHYIMNSQEFDRHSVNGKFNISLIELTIMYPYLTIIACG